MSSAITPSISAPSATVVASGPFSLILNQPLPPNSLGTTPRPGLKPNNPQSAAGMRIEPRPSFPCANSTCPLATAAAAPPDEPPGVRAGFHGLRVTVSSLSVVPHKHSSGTAVRPMTTAPAARSLRTTVWSLSAGARLVAADPTVIGSPATDTLSLMATGTPARGSFARSGWAVSSSASATALPARTLTNAPMEPSRSAIRDSASRVTCTGSSRPVRTPSAVCTALTETNL